MSVLPYRTGLTVQRLRVRMVAEKAGRLPGYKGSLLRGALGWALRRIACLTRRFDCPECPVADRCLYAELFEPKGPAAVAERGFENAPRPYVVEPPLDMTRDYAAGQVLEWHLVLIGSAARALPYVLLAVDQLAVRGLGPQRVPFSVSRIEAVDGTPLYVDGRPDLGRLSARELTDQDVALPGATDEPATLRLRFLTPTRLVADGQMVDRPTPDLLAAALARRVAVLSELYGGGASLPPHERLMDVARQARLAETSLQWMALRRFSTRQKATVSMGGFVGTVVLEGVPAELRWLLAWGEVLHVGKGTVFGLGQYQIDLHGAAARR